MTASYAYPGNIIDKPTRVSRSLEWAMADQITGFGRWSRCYHMNSDIAVKQAIALATGITPDTP